MSGYRLLGKLGHRAGRLHPSLVQLKSNWGALPSLKGVRANTKAEIFHNDEFVQGSTGELQFTEQGLSGPVIFEISRNACTSSGRWICKLDFLPEMDKPQLLEILVSRKTTPLTIQELLTGILHNRLGRVLAQTAGLDLSAPCKELTEGQLEDLCAVIKGLEVALTEPMGMDSAQVTAGGVLTEGFDPQTMESRTIKGLYACGEVLDIDGDCGGYNLQWAWSSGRLAGQQAGKDAK
jgi:predicted Rossmann fold flavoprotein